MAATAPGFSFDFAAKENRYLRLVGAVGDSSTMSAKVYEDVREASVCAMLQAWWICLVDPGDDVVEEHSYKWLLQTLLLRVLPPDARKLMPSLIDADWRHDADNGGGVLPASAASPVTSLGRSMVLREASLLLPSPTHASQAASLARSSSVHPHPRTPGVVRYTFFISLYHLCLMFSSSILLSAFDFLRIMHHSVFDKPGGGSAAAHRCLQRVESVREKAARHIVAAVETSPSFEEESADLEDLLSGGGFDEAPPVGAPLGDAAARRIRALYAECLLGTADDPECEGFSACGRVLYFVKGGGLRAEREAVKQKHILAAGGGGGGNTAAAAQSPAGPITPGLSSKRGFGTVAFQTFDLLLAYTLLGAASGELNIDAILGQLHFRSAHRKRGSRKPSHDPRGGGGGGDREKAEKKEASAPSTPAPPKRRAQAPLFCGLGARPRPVTLWREPRSAERARVGGSARWEVPWGAAKAAVRPRTAAGASLALHLHNRAGGGPVAAASFSAFRSMNVEAAPVPAPPAARRERLMRDPRLLPDAFVLCRNALRVRAQREEEQDLQEDRLKAAGAYRSHARREEEGRAYVRLYRCLKRHNICGASLRQPRRPQTARVGDGSRGIAEENVT